MSSSNTGFREKETVFKGKFASTVLETLIQAYRPFSGAIAATFFIGFTGRLFLLANANLIGMWVDSFCTGQTYCKPLPSIISGFDTSDYISWLLILASLGFLFTLIYRVWFSRLSALAVSQLYDETTLRTSRFPMLFFDRTPVGRVVTRFSSDYGSIFRLFGGPLAEFFAIVFDLLAMMILISIASPFYLPLVLIMALANYALWKFNQNRLRAARRDLSALRSPSIAHFAETAQGASTIRSFLKQNIFKNRFFNLDGRFLDQKLKTTKSVLGFSVQMNFLTALLLLITGAVAWWLLQKGLMTVGSIGVAFGFIVLSGYSVQMFFEWMTQFEEALVGVERMDNYLRKEIETGSKLPAQATFNTGHNKMQEDEQSLQQDFINKLPVSSSIEFKNISFRYSQEMDLILKDISFEISPGERLGVIGRTGSGKSTLIQALFALYPIDKGDILINQVSFKNMDIELYRKQMSLIAQEPILFQTSLRNNLDLEYLFTDEQIFSVLNTVGLEKWANSKSLQMPIQEKARNLSVGEKQLVCMARCLLARSPIVVLDEATANVDPQSEETMVRATEEFFASKTQIIIAHRLSTLQKCHRLLWLDQGRIRMLDKVDLVLEAFQRSQSGLESDRQS